MRIVCVYQPIYQNMSTIIYIPGMGGAPYQFRKMAEKMEAAGHDSIFFMYEGHQRGSLAEGFSQIILPDYVSQALSLIDAVPLGKKIILVGHSLGGVIAAMAASERPDRVIKIIIIGIPMTGHPMSDAANEELGALMPDIEAGNPIFLKQEVIKKLFFSGEWHVSIPQIADQATPPLVLLAIATGILERPPLNVAVHVVSAGNDATDPVENHIKYAADNAANHVLIPGASHCGVLEHEEMIDFVLAEAA